MVELQPPRSGRPVGVHSHAGAVHTKSLLLKEYRRIATLPPPGLSGYHSPPWHAEDALFVSQRVRTGTAVWLGTRVCHPVHPRRQACGRTSRGHTGGRSHRISHPPSLCGACLNFSREKDSAIPFPRRP